MSQYYNPNRQRNIYDPNSSELFRLSRGKIDIVKHCARVLYEKFICIDYTGH